MSNEASQTALLDELNGVLGPDSVMTGESNQLVRTQDWSGMPSETPIALLKPRKPEEVAAALRICSAHGQPVCVQGGLTGLAGGANPERGEVALSLSRLDRIEDLDELGGTVVAQAGVTLSALHAAVEARGWFYPLDLGARGSCQIGGNAATNAGGNRVLNFGMMRESILGLEVALADGRLITMLDRVMKNNAGYDLKHLFIGTEGTLGVITRLALKLEPLPPASVTALCAVEDFERAAALLREGRGKLSRLSSFELMWEDYFRASTAALKKTNPFERSYPLYVVIETLVGESETGSEAMERFLEVMLEQGIIHDAIRANSIAQARQIWAFRDIAGELVTQLKPSIAFDISMAMPRMSDFVAHLGAGLKTAFPEQKHLFFGHLGDGNLHLITGPFGSESQLHDMEQYVYESVERVQGSISAEHGIGKLKKRFLSYSRDQYQVEMMRGLKNHFDPQHILNRGRVIQVCGS